MFPLVNSFILSFSITEFTISSGQNTLSSSRIELPISLRSLLISYMLFLIFLIEILSQEECLCFTCETFYILLCILFL